MQFSSRYDRRRIAARPALSFAGCFKSLVDWFDYAYAVLPAAASLVRNPPFRLSATRTPSVIHLRSPFSRDPLDIASGQGAKAPRSVMTRPLAKVTLFAILLLTSYAALTVTGGGPSLASAPSAETATPGAFSVQAAPDGVTQKTSEVVSPEADQSTLFATPVKTLQSSIEPQAAPAVTAAETSAEAAKPIPAPILAATPMATPTATQDARTVAAPAAPTASVPPPVPQVKSNYYTAPEIRAFAAAAGWDAKHLDSVVQVAWCESTNNAAAIGGGGAQGLMQVMPFWFRVAGVDVASWSDPVSNLKVALVAFQADIAESKPPWSAWDCKPER